MKKNKNKNKNKTQKSPEKELHKMERSNLLDAEFFKTLALRMLNELRRRVNEPCKNFKKEIGNIKIEIKNIKKNQSYMENKFTEMKDTLQVINGEVDEAEDQIRDLKNTE